MSKYFSLKTILFQIEQRNECSQVVPNEDEYELLFSFIFHLIKENWYTNKCQWQAYNKNMYLLNNFEMMKMITMKEMRRMMLLPKFLLRTILRTFLSFIHAHTHTLDVCSYFVKVKVISRLNVCSSRSVAFILIHIV